MGKNEIRPNPRKDRTPKNGEPPPRLKNMPLEQLKLRMLRISTMASLALKPSDIMAQMGISAQEYTWLTSHDEYRLYNDGVRIETEGKQLEGEKRLLQARLTEVSQQANMQLALHRIRAAAVDAVEVLHEIAVDKKMNPKFRLEAAESLIDRAGFTKGHDIYVHNNVSGSVQHDIISDSLKVLGAEIIDMEEAHGGSSSSGQPLAALAPGEEAHDDGDVGEG